MTNTKKISELSVLEQVTEQTYLLVEQDGVACRLPISVLGEYLGTVEPAAKEFTFNIYRGDNIEDIFGTYTAVEGMAWADWVESEYNTDGIYIQEVDEKVCVLMPNGLITEYGNSVDASGNINHIDLARGGEAISPDLYYFYK